jgi:hypothetical protein
MLKRVIAGEKPAIKTPFEHSQILSKKRSKLKIIFTSRF